MAEYKVIRINYNCYLEYKINQDIHQCYIIALDKDGKYIKVSLYSDDAERLIQGLQECLYNNQEQNNNIKGDINDKKN
jgi:hypothetical protein